MTWYSAVPTVHQLILARGREGDRAGTRTLRFVRSASAKLAEATLLGLEEVLGVPVLEAYGMTEASHQIASNPLPPAPRVSGSVGRGIGVRVGVMDAQGRLLTVGASGEVVVQGPNVIDGYDDNAEADARSFTNGWFRTGDQGFLDSAGYLTLVGRLKEMINRGGEKIAPHEIDAVLLEHPAVADAVSFGVPHPTWGEVVEAAVVPAGDVTEAQLLRHCREHLAEFKVPVRLHLMDSLPKTATGKVQRTRMAGVHARRLMKLVVARGRRDRWVPRGAPRPGRDGRDPRRSGPTPRGDAGARGRGQELPRGASWRARPAPTTCRS